MITIVITTMYALRTRVRLVCLSLMVMMSLVGAVTAFSPDNGDDIDVDGLSYSVQNADRPWSLQNPEPGTLRFELRPGDVWYQDSPIKERAEIAGETIYAAGKDIAVHYEFRVDPGPENTSDWLLIGQMHATDEFSTPIFAVELIGEHLAIHLRYKLPGKQYKDWFAFVDDDPIVRGKYYTIDADLHMHNNEKGSVDVWIDGEHVVDYSGFVGYGYGVYWKQGIYRAAAPEDIAVEYRNLHIDGEVGVRIEGTSGDDKITPNHRPPGSPAETNQGDIIEGRGGEDYIKGGVGHDLLFGGAGDDVLIGGRNDDTLVGGPGDGRLKGGWGHDVFRFEGTSGRDVVLDYRHDKDLIALDHDRFKSEEGVLSHFHQTKNGAVLAFDNNTILFKDTKVGQFHADDFLLV